MPKKFQPKIVSANALLGGEAVYFAAPGDWRDEAAEARVAETPEAAEALLAEAAAEPGRVVGPYLTAVSLEEGAPAPIHYRERIRVSGPTFREDLARASSAAGERAE